MEELTLITPTFLFSAVSLILLAYTNRFVVIANLIRELYAQHTKEPSEITFEQLANLHQSCFLIHKTLC